MFESKTQAFFYKDFTFFYKSNETDWWFESEAILIRIIIKAFIFSCNDMPCVSFKMLWIISAAGFDCDQMRFSNYVFFMFFLSLSLFNRKWFGNWRSWNENWSNRMWFVEWTDIIRGGHSLAHYIIITVLMKLKQIELTLFRLWTWHCDVRHIIVDNKWTGQNIMNENKIIIEPNREETTKITIIVIRTKSSAKARPQLPEMFTFEIHTKEHSGSMRCLDR